MIQKVGVSTVVGERFRGGIASSLLFPVGPKSSKPLSSELRPYRRSLVEANRRTLLGRGLLIENHNSDDRFMAREEWFGQISRAARPLRQVRHAFAGRLLGGSGERNFRMGEDEPWTSRSVGFCFRRRFPCDLTVLLV
jgi:hypothetical protein